MYMFSYIICACFLILLYTIYRPCSIFSSGRLVAQFFSVYSIVGGREHVSLQSVKYESRGWYITVQSSNRIRGSVPASRNELFSIVSISGSTFALRTHNAIATAGGGSGDGAVNDCYLGFSISTGRPSCYSSTDHVETHLLFIDAGLL